MTASLTNAKTDLFFLNGRRANIRAEHGANCDLYARVDRMCKMAASHVASLERLTNAIEGK